jgi:lambda family phage portal protein
MSLTSLNLDLEPLALIRKRQDRERVRRMNARSYQAGMINRLNRDFPVFPASQRYEIYRALRPMRARMRYLAHNSDHFKKFLSMVRNNVAGPHGMTLQAKGPDPTRNQEIETAFARWSHPENASASGRLSWAGILRRLTTVLARDGEVLIREIMAGPFGYQIKFYDVAWLDENFNETAANGNRIINSVELDANDRPVAYHFTPPAEQMGSRFRPTPKDRTRIPAGEIFHIFLPDDENSSDDTQTRGVPWAHTAALTLFNLDKADEAALYAQRAAASKMGFFTKEVDDDEGGDESEDPAAAPEIIDHFEPGTFWDLPPGYDFTPFDPQSPSEGHGPFAKYMLRRAASGLDVAYNSLGNDLEGVNYSSIRAGLVEEREIWKALQEFVIESFARPCFLHWLREAVLMRQLTLSARELAAYSEPTFQARRWSWVDPLKDIQAKQLAIASGLDTITDTLAEMGHDRAEVFKTRRAELDAAAELDLTFSTGEKTAAPTNDPQDSPDAPEKT